MKNYIALSLLIASSTPLMGQCTQAEVAPLLDFVAQHRDTLAMYAYRSKTIKTERFKKKPVPAPSLDTIAKAITRDERVQKTKKSSPAKVSVPVGPTPEELAFETVRDAAIGGYVPAQDILAYCYATGAGTKVNSRLAFSWYLKAALEGSKSALDSLIACFEGGIGVAKDSKIAKILTDILKNTQDDIGITRTDKINQILKRSVNVA